MLPAPSPYHQVFCTVQIHNLLLLLLLLGRITVLRTQMQPIVTDEIAWSVRYSVMIISSAKR